jgi:phasin family protein
VAKQTNPFFNVDASKFMADFDPAKMAEEFAKMASGYKIPSFDMDALFVGQRKNIEALTAANKAAAEGLKQVAERQAEILQDSLNEATKAFDVISKSATAQDAASKQAELYQTAFTKALANMQELADMVTKSNSEATEVVNARLTESLDEIKALAKKMK